MPTAVLSTTAKAKERMRKKEVSKKGATEAKAAAAAPGDKMDTDNEAKPAAASEADSEVRGCGVEGCLGAST